MARTLRHGRLLAALLWLSSATAAAAQQTPPPPDPPQPVVLDFTIDSGRMTVPVMVDGQGPFGFVIDTGADRTVVSRELAARLRLPPGEPGRLFDFVGVSDVATVRVRALAVSDLPARSIDAPALDWVHLGAAGMLGIDALQDHKVAIDFPRNRIEVKPSRKRYVPGQVVVAAEQRAGQLIVTQAWFQGQPIAVIVDTGSWVTVGNHAMLALANKPPRKLGLISVTSVTGRSFTADLNTVNDLKIGGVRLDNVGISFVDVAPFERFGLRDTPALILGMSTLKLFRRVEIDFANREIAFTLPRPPISFATACRSYSNCTNY
jgi:predicted aspartyl protease